MRSLMVFCAATAAVAGGAGCDALQRFHGGGGMVSGALADVEQVVKGDELAVHYGGVTSRVRMLGIEAFAPVVADAAFVHTYDVQAVGYLKAHTEGGVQLFFDAPTRDTYGRYLAYVQAGSMDLGFSMVRQGLVCVYTEFAFGRESAYLEAESEARRTHAGLWSDPQAAATVIGLRKNWRAARRKRGDKVLFDPLLN